MALFIPFYRKNHIRLSQKKTATEQPTTFIEHLKREYEEPSTLKRRRLAAELSSMTQKTGEKVNQFTFRFRNVLHQMERLGEKVAKDCPTYVVSQFLAKVKPEITQQLILIAEKFTTLKKAAESARRMELSLQTKHVVTYRNRRTSMYGILKMLSLLLRVKTIQTHF